VLPVLPVLPIFAFVVLAAFLACLGLFALAVTKVVAPDGRGHARGLGGGLAALIALVLLMGLGFVGLAATVGAIALGSLSDWNPIERIEIRRTHPSDADANALSAAPERARGKHRHERESAVSARFTVRDGGGGEGGPELVELLHDLVDVDLAELGDGLTIHHREDDDGRDFSVYEFRLPIRERDLAEFERDLRVELDGLELRLPDEVEIEFEGAR
jgi:hypothetical protein